MASITATNSTDSDPAAAQQVERLMIRQYGLEALASLQRTKGYLLVQSRTDARDKAIAAMDKAIATIEDGIA